MPSGPFTGVPYLLKDIGPLYASTVTTLGSSAFRNFIPDHDSEMVVRLKRAGLVIFGKTHTPEFGLSSSSESRLFGATHNPWNPEYSAGGSSGGSVAAIASRMVPMAYGSDGGGSIRIPASCCGLFGLKPTRARTPVGPDLGEWWSGLAIAHTITRSVRDSAALLDATCGAEIGDLLGTVAEAPLSGQGRGRPRATPNRLYHKGVELPRCRFGMPRRGGRGGETVREARAPPLAVCRCC